MENTLLEQVTELYRINYTKFGVHEIDMVQLPESLKSFVSSVYINYSWLCYKRHSPDEYATLNSSRQIAALTLSTWDLFNSVKRA